MAEARNIILTGASGGLGEVMTLALASKEQRVIFPTTNSGFVSRSPCGMGRTRS